jgi:hypothetical protein
VEYRTGRLVGSSHLALLHGTVTILSSILDPGQIPQIKGVTRYTRMQGCTDLKAQDWLTSPKVPSS